MEPTDALRVRSPPGAAQAPVLVFFGGDAPRVGLISTEAPGRASGFANPGCWAGVPGYPRAEWFAECRPPCCLAKCLPWGATTKLGHPGGCRRDRQVLLAYVYTAYPPHTLHYSTLPYPTRPKPTLPYHNIHSTLHLYPTLPYPLPYLTLHPTHPLPYPRLDPTLPFTLPYLLPYLPYLLPYTTLPSTLPYPILPLNSTCR